jgi:hypothetical protein
MALVDSSTAVVAGHGSVRIVGGGANTATGIGAGLALAYPAPCCGFCGYDDR